MPTELIASSMFIVIGVVTLYLIVKRAERRYKRDENDKLFK